jgi:hypothetical protein
MQLASHSGEGVIADEAEILVPDPRRICVDPGQIDDVLPAEIGDGVDRAPWRGVRAPVLG